MKHIKNRFRALLLCLSVLALLLASVPVSAEALSEEEKEYLGTAIASYQENLFGIGDEDLENFRKQGGFGEVFYGIWNENKEITGNLVSVDSVEIDDSDPAAVKANSVLTFEKYKADVTLYFTEDMTNFRNIEMNVRYSLAEKMLQAFQNMVVGLLVVFTILVFLTFIISAFKLLQPRKKEEKQASPAPAAKAAPAAPAVRTAAPAAAQKDDEIAAVIAAAIAAAMADEPAAGGYVVRSVRRLGRTGWKRV